MIRWWHCGQAYSLLECMRKCPSAQDRHWITGGLTYDGIVSYDDEDAI